MNYTSRNTIILKLTVQISEILLLNFLYFILAYIFKNHSLFQSNALSYWLLGNISYIVSLSIVDIVLHRRTTSPEYIISRAGRTMIFHAMCFLALLSLSAIPSPPFFKLVTFYIIAFILITTERLVLRKLIKMGRKGGADDRSAILVGEGRNMVEIAESMADPWYGYKLQGVFSDNDISGFPNSIEKKGAVKDVISWLSEHKVDEIYCGLPSVYGDNIVEIINYCENNLIRFYSVPNLRNYLKRKVSTEKFGDVLILAIRQEPLGLLRNRFIKRALDVVVSGLFLLLIYPIVYLIVGIAVKLSSPGPIYFKQERTGIDGKSFKCIKFRSMRQNKDCDKVQATQNDPRKTKVGNFLRKSNIDELPQFINVWKGEMSIVGPRPHMLKHTEEYSQLINKYMVRHLVKPGITGWAQINGFRGETKELSEMEGRVKHDIWYLENWTFWLDIHIIITTFVSMLFKKDKNAY